jgi:hypothetical protein
MQVLPGTGHLSPLESSAEIGKIIGEFAAELERAGNALHKAA